MYLYKCKMHVSRVESLSFHMSFYDHITSGFQCPSVYRQTRYTAKLTTAQKVAV